MSNPGPSLRGAVDLSGLVRRANTPPPASAAPGEPGDAAGGAPAASGVVVDVTEASFPQVVELSTRVPVVVELYAPGLEPALARIVESYGGRLVLATVDAQANPGIAQAFQVREVPAVAAIIGGRPVPMFVGIPSDEEVRQVLDQLLQLAAQNGVTGSVDAGAAPAEGAEPVEEPLPPLHQEAYDAISTGDYAGAVAAYRKAIAQNPRDALAVAGLAQASLLQRLDGAVAEELRAAAAAAPGSAAAQLAVADLDVSGGHLDDAFDRLLELFPSLDGEGREAVRTRLLEYFEIAGADDPRVAAARRRLTLLLY
jgi:Thioredoxin domain-containing protein